MLIGVAILMIGSYPLVICFPDWRNSHQLEKQEADMCGFIRWQS